MISGLDKLEKQEEYAPFWAVQKYVDNPQITRKRPLLEEFKTHPDYEADKRYVEEMRGKIKAEWNTDPRTYLRSQIFEGFLALRAKELFGSNVESVPASEYDDYANGVDLVLEIAKENNEVLRLSIDASFLNAPELLDAKNMKIKKQLTKGEMSVKYFKSILEPGKIGQIPHIPRIILALDSMEWNNFLPALETPMNNNTRVILQEVFFDEIKTQLENQFIFELGMNGYRVDTAKRGAFQRNLKPKEEVLVRRIYDAARELTQQEKWNEERIIKLFELFDKKGHILKQVSFPERFALLTNTRILWSWVNESLQKVRENAPEELKEKAASFRKAAIVQRLVTHWPSEKFDYWPIFVH